MIIHKNILAWTKKFKPNMKYKYDCNSYYVTHPERLDIIFERIQNTGICVSLLAAHIDENGTQGQFHHYIIYSNLKDNKVLPENIEFL